MLVYDKISWCLPMCPDILSFSLGKEKLRLIRKGFAGMFSFGYTFGVASLTLSLLEEFYPLYMSYISTKQNAHPTNLIEYYNPRLLTDELYFAFLRDQSGQLLAGCIIVNKMLQAEQTLMLSFRASLPDASFQKLRLGYYLEYLFFDLGLSLGVAQYSRGRDRNGYGFFGSDIGVCVHKLQLHFSPYISASAMQLLIDEDTIVDSSLFFINPDASGKLSAARLFLLAEEDKYRDFISIFSKRGIALDILVI